MKSVFRRTIFVQNRGIFSHALEKLPDCITPRILHREISVRPSLEDRSIDLFHQLFVYSNGNDLFVGRGRHWRYYSPSVKDGFQNITEILLFSRTSFIVLQYTMWNHGSTSRTRRSPMGPWSQKADPELRARVRAGFRGAGTKAMFETATRDLESPAHDGASYLTCTTCGERVVAIETRGPSHHVAVPCGHRVSPTTRECVGSEDAKLVTDGGRPISWQDLSGFQRDALEAIRRIEAGGKTPYGLSVKRELQALYDEEINHGRLYPNLDTLVNAGLVEKGTLDKRTNSYELTETARAMLRERVSRLANACGMEQPVADGGEQA